ncbi:hypothetical protein IJF93_00335 [Candidatus Saccharibacteria bacterium]|nr:hypothetical protein [Candidatus Saccharibacteria bacterium]
MANTFAEGSSSYFDAAGKNCIIDNYNAEFSTSVTSIEEVDFTKVTTLNCSNRGIVYFRGITLFPNLEKFDVSYNPSLRIWDMDFSQNTKLKEINVKGISNTYYDFSNNPNLETIGTDHSLYLKTIAYAEKIDKELNGTNFQYGIDLSVLKFLDSSSTHEVWFPDKSSVDNTVSILSGGYTHQVDTRGGWVSYAIFLNGDTEVETHNPIYLNSNCDKNEYGYYSCNDSIYHGDIIDTDDIIANTLSKIFNLSKYELSKVEIVPPTANLELTTDTDTVKKGIALADANFTLEFNFELASDTDSSSSSSSSTASTPETGTFTADGKGLVAGVSAVSLAVIAMVAYALRYVSKRNKAKVSFGRK